MMHISSDIASRRSLCCPIILLFGVCPVIGCNSHAFNYSGITDMFPKLMHGMERSCKFIYERNFDTVR